MLHVYFSLRQYLATLKGFFAYLHDKLCLLGGCIKNKIVSFFDPRIRDPHSIIINILVLFAFMSIFISLLAVLVSYKIIFIPVLQVVVYIRRATIILRVLKIIGSYLQKLDFRNIAVIELAMIPLRPLGTVKGVDFYLTQMSRPERKEFMRTYKDEYLARISELTDGDRKEVVKGTELFIKRGLAEHFSISARVGNSDIDGHSLLVNSALTTSASFIEEMNVALYNTIILLRPELNNSFSTVRSLPEGAIQFLVSNILTARSSRGIRFVENSASSLNPAFFSNQNVEQIADHVLENMSPLCKELEGVKGPEAAALIIHRYGRELSKPNECGISRAVVVPYLEKRDSVGIGNILDII